MSTFRKTYRKIMGKTKRILVHDKMDITRLGLIFGSAFWGFQLLLPVALFPSAEQIATHSGRTTYALMAMIAPENVWGLLFLVQSVCAAYTLFSGARDKLTLLMDGFLGCLLWTASTAACYVAYWPVQLPLFDAAAVYVPPAAMSGEAVMAFYSWWHMIRHWAEEPASSTFYDIDGGT